MPVWPKSLITIGTGLLTARTASRLRRKKTAVGDQEATLARLTAQFAQTRFWPNAGIGEKLGPDAFRTATPLRTYEGFAPAIEKMKQGEADEIGRAHV